MFVMALAMTAATGCPLLAGDGGGAPSKIPASPVHMQHRGGMVFAGSPVDGGSGPFKDNFAIGDPLYGEFFAAADSKDAARSIDTIDASLRATVDGVMVSEFPLKLEADWMSSEFPLVRDKDNSSGRAMLAWTLQVPRWFADKVVRQMSPGPHDLRLDVVSRGAPVATGTIKVTAPSNVAAWVAGALAQQDQFDGESRRLVHRERAANAQRQPAPEATTRSPSEPPCEPNGTVVTNKDHCCSGKATSNTPRCCGSKSSTPVNECY
jgi:hypothetical protein